MSKRACALAHDDYIKRNALMRLGIICNRRMPTFSMMLCGALAPTQPLIWTSIYMMWSCALSQSQSARGAVIIAMICASALINGMMELYACNYNCRNCALMQIDVMMQSNACDCNRWLCALPQVNMIWCNQMLAIAIVDFVLCRKSMWYETISNLWLQSLTLCFAATQYDMMQSNAWDYNRWLCASLQVNMIWAMICALAPINGMMELYACNYNCQFCALPQVNVIWDNR